ncbi:hypothetical protein Q5424_04790 [Conexibacter sp. JD483]|uniref:hypothetical protein n=1 Tax=unclassified Conexibacter TaxID=2627773 RepID=UPI00271ED211|nr:MULTISPECIES: hypothetical protein [unclassified Conexibacter]MDO8184649.1 hypothetical protein [Conexibacter sp. CPCC 205706]MDO8197955.1 hypothetical protein [Conexibacter sp. CPCC 205762]MDR9368385.1 hypothetical protein [Conexibacter sp. JD483]
MRVALVHALRLRAATAVASGAGRLLAVAAVLLAAVPLLLVTAVVSVVGTQRQAAATRCEQAGAAGGPAVGGGMPAGLSPGARARFHEPLQLEPGRWYRTGATWFPDGTGAIPDSRQSDLTQHPDSFAELSLAPTNPANTRTFRFEDANALGTLPFMTALRVAKGDRSLVVYKRDVGYGQGTDVTASGERFRIDLLKSAADELGVTKDEVKIALAPRTGAGATLGETPDSVQTDGADLAGADCAAMLQQPTGGSGPLPLTAGERARLLPSGLAAAPRRAPRAVREIIAAGNRIVGKPYLYGGAHGSPLSVVMPAYDCSSSVSFLLYGAGLVDVNDTPPSGEMATSLGLPGYGRWVSVLANGGHVYAYVAGLRWDTHNAVAGEQGVAGIGWHTGRRDDHAFTPRHPKGL